MERPIRSLLFSTLYPNSESPGHGIFVETRLRHLVASGEVAAEVLAPVPWFPFRSPIFGEYARLARVPRFEQWNGFAAHHPRFLRLPKVGMTQAPFALARAGLRTVRSLRAAGRDFDLIDAHYFFPDGVAAAMIGEKTGKPVIITARGSDINLIARMAEPRQLILEASRKASAIIAVSAALRDAMIEIGIDRNKVTVLGNGVDAAAFYEEDRVAARSRWGADGYVLVSAGNLVPIKGHDVAIRAIRALPDATLFIAGQGPERGRLEQLAAAIGVSSRVRFVGYLAQSDLRSLYSAADCLVLASEREGWPNVVLEAMACGAAVIASRVGGIPEILENCSSALLLDRRDDAALASAVGVLRSAAPSRQSARAHAARHDWSATTAGQLKLFRSVIGAAHA